MLQIGNIGNYYTITLQPKGNKHCGQQRIKLMFKVSV
jgi:hypothetical protein